MQKAILFPRVQVFKSMHNLFPLVTFISIYTNDFYFILLVGGTRKRQPEVFFTTSYRDIPGVAVILVIINQLFQCVAYYTDTQTDFGGLSYKWQSFLCIICLNNLSNKIVF